MQLEPDTTYEVRLSLQGGEVEQFEATTWSEQFPSQDNTTRVTEAGLERYEVTESGTPSNYHVIDGMRDDGTRTVIDSGKNSRFNVRIDASYVVLR